MYKLNTTGGAPIVVYIAMYYVSRYISCLEYIMEPMVLIPYPVIHHQTCLPLFQPDTVLADFKLRLRSAIVDRGDVTQHYSEGCYFHSKLTPEYQVIGLHPFQQIGALPFVPEKDRGYA